jgi:hypothetical protein
MALMSYRSACFRSLVWLGYLVAAASPAGGQILTINGAGSAAAPSGADFATTVIGDPWDFNERSDFVYMFSDDGSNPSPQPAFTSIPTVAGGVLSGVARSNQPGIQLQFEGIDGAINSVGRTGVVFPIDANRFRRLSFRAYRSSNIPAIQDFVGAFWWPNTGRGDGGLRYAFANGFTDLAPIANMSPTAQQGAAGWHIYRIDLDLPNALQSGTPWAGIMRGLLIRLAANSNTAAGSTFTLDWVRLTERTSATTRQLSWSGFNGPVTLTAAHAQTGDVIQIYPENSGSTFPASGSYAWDVGYLPPGTWIVTAQAGGAVSNQVTLTIDPAPYLTITEPDAAGGRDYAATVLGDALDLSNPQDVTRYGRLWQMASAQFSEQGFIGTTTGQTDSFVQFIDDWTDPPGTAITLDANTYHRLSFTIEYDHKELMFWQALAPQWGGVARVAWSRGSGAPYTVSQDIFVLDGGPNTYTMDLASFVDQSTLEDPIVSLWNGAFPTFRIDTDESATPRQVRLSNVKLAADDAPNGNGIFAIRWSVADALFSGGLADSGGADAVVNVHVDTDLNPAAGLTLLGQVPASNGVLHWNTADMPAGVYYVYLSILDSHGNGQARYAGGPIRISTPFPPITDANANGLPDSWEATYVVSSPQGDEDEDAVPNSLEYLQATHPRLPNTWTLPEGATGSFNQRLAIANPDAVPAEAKVTFLRPSPAPPIVRQYPLLPFGRASINVNEVAGLDATVMSTVVEATTGGVIAERTMFWGDLFYGGHTGKAIAKAGTQWFLAEGVANAFFDTFVLLANPGGTAANVQVTFLREGIGPVVTNYVVQANSRVTIFTDEIPELFGHTFSTRVDSSTPIGVERALYFSNARFWNGGHAAAAVPAPQTSWYVAEGATGGFFSTFVLLGNPNPFPVNALIRYLLPGGGQIVENEELQGQSRTTIPLNGRVTESGQQIPDGEVSVAIDATAPIIVERAMYWPGADWTDAHASFGLSTTGVSWAFAEGEIGGPHGFFSYVLFANPTSQTARVQLRFLPENGASFVAPLFDVAPNSRVTRSMADFIGPGRFGLRVDSVDGVPIVTERAVYWNGGGEFWGGGTNETAVKIR